MLAAEFWDDVIAVAEEIVLGTFDGKGSSEMASDCENIRLRDSSVDGRSGKSRNHNPNEKISLLL